MAVRKHGQQVPNGITHSIHEAGSPVKPDLNSRIETQQFKNWLGNWKKIRLYEADKKKNVSINQEEFIDAMSRMDLIRAEKSRLWTSNGWKDKNTPYK